MTDAEKNECYEAFLRAFEEVPTQDNEGYVPDRGGFKCGFFSAWRLLISRVRALEAEVEDWRDAARVWEDDNRNQSAALEVLHEGLGTIVSLTHSWVITPETAPCAQVFEQIREQARKLRGEGT